MTESYTVKIKDRTEDSDLNNRTVHQIILNMVSARYLLLMADTKH